jgi:hypothetical protein
MGSNGSSLSEFECYSHAGTNCLICPPPANRQISTAGTSRYLTGLAFACLEAARNPRLVGVLVGVLKLAPRTLGELAKGPAGEKQSPCLRGHRKL